MLILCALWFDDVCKVDDLQNIIKVILEYISNWNRAGLWLDMNKKDILMTCDYMR